jgi:serine/threonine-protein kinase RsbW
MNNFSLDLPDKFGYLQLARQFTKDVCSFLPEQAENNEITDDTQLAISEACTNAMIHGKSPGSIGRVFLNFKIFPDKILIRVMDQGKGFDLESIPPPNMDDPQENGYGVFIIKIKMDHVEYQRGKEWNTMIMEKHF